MKRIGVLLFLVCLCFCIVSCGENHGELLAHGECDDFLKWELYEDGFLVISGKGKMKENPWIKYAEYIKNVKIEDEVQSLMDGAFIECSAVESVSIGEGVTEIPAGTFADCVSLKNITIPDSVTYIDPDAFDNCSSIVSITLPAGITHVSFDGCTALENVILPEGVISVYFADCSALDNITLPNGITDVCFNNCTTLKNILLPENVTTVSFIGCTSLTSLSLPESLTSIGDSAFKGCASLESISLPKSLTSIGTAAFAGCTRLKAVKLPDSLKSIGESAFDGCEVLENITLPESLMSIGASAFRDCALHTVSIPSQITVLEDKLFYNCWELKEVYFPEGITTIYPSAFRNCNQLEKVYYAGEDMPSVVYPKWSKIDQWSSSYEWKYERSAYLYEIFDDVDFIINGEMWKLFEDTGRRIMDDIKDANVGDVICFGQYEQDNDTSNGKEEIYWIVEDKQGGKLLLASCYILDFRPYHGVAEQVTWETCDLRAWLNGEFLENAFSDEEMKSISITTNNNPDDTENKADGGNDTEDRVFVPSSGGMHDAMPTNYAITQGITEISSGEYMYWLRAPSFEETWFQTTYFFVQVTGEGNKADVRVKEGIRPMIWIDLSVFE